MGQKFSQGTLGTAHFFTWCLLGLVHPRWLLHSQVWRLSWDGRNGLPRSYIWGLGSHCCLDFSSLSHAIPGLSLSTWPFPVVSPYSSGFSNMVLEEEDRARERRKLPDLFRPGLRNPKRHFCFILFVKANHRHPRFKGRETSRPLSLLPTWILFASKLSILPEDSLSIPCLYASLVMTHSLNKYLLKTYSVPETLLDAEHIAVHPVE